MKIERSKEWWMQKAASEGDSVVAAGMPNQPPETTLLLTVARILRARLSEIATAYVDDDRAALDEALTPFDPLTDSEAHYAGAMAQALRQQD